MPTIVVSESLLAFLKKQAAVGHAGDINDYLHSLLNVRNIPTANPDRTVLEFIGSPTYIAQVTPAKKYLALLSFLYAADPLRFATLEGFKIPASDRVLLASNVIRIERSDADARAVLLKDAGFFVVSPRGHQDARDLTVHVMKELGYPLGVWQAVRGSMADNIDLSILDV